MLITICEYVKNDVLLFLLLLLLSTTAYHCFVGGSNGAEVLLVRPRMSSWLRVRCTLGTCTTLTVLPSTTISLTWTGCCAWIACLTIVLCSARTPLKLPVRVAKGAGAAGGRPGLKDAVGRWGCDGGDDACRNQSPHRKSFVVR